MIRLALIFILSSLTLQAATLAQVRTRVDDWLTARWQTVVNRQNNFFEQHGRYWQGLVTHADFPNHTSQDYGDTAADRLGIKPSDEVLTWAEAFPALEGINFPAALRIDNYESPEGHGWVATIWVMHNGTIYTRAQNIGPETWRTHGWRIHVEYEI